MSTVGVHRRGRPGYGNSYQRRARRERIWAEKSFAVVVYSPIRRTAGVVARRRRVVKCHHCPRLLARHEFHVDRWPVCGHDGGTYAAGNVVPACEQCNVTRCTVECGAGGKNLRYARELSSTPLAEKPRKRRRSSSA